MDVVDKDVEALIWRLALRNAVKFGGKARVKPVIGKLLSERPELRRFARDLRKIVEGVVEKVNSMSLDEQEAMLDEVWPGWRVEKVSKAEAKKGLPPLPNVERYERVVTRFAPNPDGPLHLGSARPVILSHEYARMYDGKFILRFEDTDPKIKRPILHLDPDESSEYDYIRRDLEWLGVSWDEEYIQSDRIEIYYEYARRLIEREGGYVCLCSRERFKALRDSGRACPHRSHSVEENLRLWDKMLSGGFKEGEAVLRVKTDLSHPDPSVRDWVAFRIVDPNKSPHPRPSVAEKKFWAWPTYNFAVTIDDHLMGITHILRAKEHLTNTVKQKFLYRHMGWDTPEFIHFGRMKLEGMVLSKSKIVKGIREGRFRSWDDPMLGTLRALRRRGIRPEAIRDLIIDVGVKPSEVTVSWENLVAANKRYIEPVAERYMFVRVSKGGKPFKVMIDGLGKSYGQLPRHPSYPERGVRRIPCGSPEFYIDAGDVEGGLVKPGLELRLIGLTNIEVASVKNHLVKARSIGDDPEYAKRRGLPIVQWVPVSGAVPVRIVKPGVVESGFGDPGLRSLKVDDIVQFIRYGFVRLDEAGEELIFYYAHE